MDDTIRRWLEAPGRYLVRRGDAAYPALWQEIADPPDVVYVEGRIELLNAPSFAIVGSRNATLLGASDAEAFARALSDAGLTIVSGLALGIDAAAHRGGLAGAASSIAVMATGADLHYPKRNRPLARALGERGCLVTEFPLGTPPGRWNFPRRNRLISGLSRGVLVVEAAPGSGSLITVACALEQNRDVFAIPGSIHAPLAKGCHKLIKDGAKLVECAADVLQELGLASREDPQGERRDAREERDTLLDAMGFAPVSIDQMVRRFGLDAATLAARLSRYELDGRVASLAGGWFQRVKRRVIE